MITVPTVLVLGAGASIPFGFPSGQTLVDIICHFLHPDGPPDRECVPLWLHRPMGETVARLTATFTRKKITSFAEHLDGEESIDAFLEHQTGDFVDIGKGAIAATLLPFERERAIFYDFATRRLEKNFLGEQHTVGMVNNWYQLLWRALDAPFEEFQENKLRIITFNYDRSLEHYLFTRLKRRNPDENVPECTTKMPLIAHIHGRLGYLPWQMPANMDRSKYVPYDAIAREPTRPEEKVELDTKKIEWFDAARTGIKVIHEGSDETDELEQAREWIRQCKRLYFLGFGYHPSNIDRLKIESLNERKHIMGTIQGLSREREEALKTMLRGRNSVGHDLSRVDANSYDFLHDQVDLTMG